LAVNDLEVGLAQGGMWKEKWMSMSDEEKEKFREQWRMRCGGQR